MNSDIEVFTVDQCQPTCNMLSFVSVLKVKNIQLESMVWCQIFNDIFILKYLAQTRDWKQRTLTARGV